MRAGFGTYLALKTDNRRPFLLQNALLFGVVFHARFTLKRFVGSSISRGLKVVKQSLVPRSKTVSVKPKIDDQTSRKGRLENFNVQLLLLLSSQQ